MKRILCLVLLIPFSVIAEDIRFDQDELAKESVTPVFKYAPVVRERKVPTEGRFEIGGIFGSDFSEAFYEPVVFGAQIAYHWSETSAIEVYGLSFSTGESAFVDELNSDLRETVSGFQDFDFSKAPTTASLVSLNYIYKPFYGKISLSKQTVINLSTYFSVGLGYVDTGDGNTISYGAGIGQKYYFSPNWGMSFDLRLAAYNAPNPLSNTGVLDGTDPNGTFDESLVTSILFTGGFFFFLPFL